MTTYGRMLNLLAILKHIKADLKALAAANTHDPKADALFLQSALEINTMLKDLEQRKREILQEEPQYFAEELTVQPGTGGTHDARTAQE
ncbi:MAG TPA: DUF1657 domain-containing protein [Firmicutes bacterium]|nr:DUF1657 domain-containing protein [Bacillota bacterium]